MPAEASRPSDKVTHSRSVERLVVGQATADGAGAY